MIISKELNDEIIEALEGLDEIIMAMEGLIDKAGGCGGEVDCFTCAAKEAGAALVKKLKKLRPEDLA